MKPYRLEPTTFRRDNLQNWRENTSFWLESSLRHVSSVKPLLRDFLRMEGERQRAPLSVVDLGCGSAWVLDLLDEMAVTAHYTGLDFNPDLISRLQKDKGTRGSFKVCDLESPVISEDLDCSADVVVSAFNFFEIPDLRRAFSNAVRMLNPGGILVICHIDPITQLLSVCDRRADLDKALRDFGTHGSSLAYDKTIELTGAQTTRKYKGILHRISDYQRLAMEFSLALEDFQEVLDIDSGPVQQYQVAKWRASDLRTRRVPFPFVRAAILLLPFAAAAYLITFYSGATDSIVWSLNRIGGNVSPISSALLLLVLAGFVTVLLSLGLYIKSCWATAKAVAGIDAARRPTAIGLGILLSVALAVVFLIVLFVLVQVHVFQAGSRLPRLLEELLIVSRYLNIYIFLGFFAVDVLLGSALRTYAATFEVRTNERRRSLVENDISFSRMSVFLVDLPVLALALLTVAVVSVFEKNSHFQYARDDSFVNHVVLSRLEPAAYVLTLHGIEAGALAVSLLISQLLFLALLARWHAANRALSPQHRRWTRPLGESASRVQMRFTSLVSRFRLHSKIDLGGAVVGQEVNKGTEGEGVPIGARGQGGLGARE